jgi:putative transposase
MGVSVFENPNAERLNGVIKNNYIRHYGPKNFDILVRETARAISMYNTQKPHSSLNKMNPVAFENKIRCLRKKN